jgi:hypothetical protein
MISTNVKTDTSQMTAVEIDAEAFKQNTPTGRIGLLS